MNHDFDVMYPLFASLRKRRPRAIAEFERVFEQAREFRQTVVEPNALELERRMMKNPRHVAEDILREASQRHYFTHMVPKMFGGEGLPFGASMIAIEEVAAGCLGIANLIGVHGLAVSTVAATGDLDKMEHVCRLLVESERTGHPKLLSTAITEPDAGSDVEDVEFLETAHLSCEAKPVKGGYRLNGRKVFISNGSIAHTHVVIMPTNKRDPVGTTFAFLVETGTPGFSVGRVERKMGQKACPAAELVFEDCFVPERQRISGKSLPGRRIALVLGATRGGVAAFGAGVARGAYERAREYALTHTLGGRRLLDEQWVQFKLADMHKNATLARNAYVTAMLENELFGLSSLVSGGELMRVLPSAVLQSAPAQRLFHSRGVKKSVREAIDDLEDWRVDASSAAGASAKVVATDLGIENCGLALDVMGAAGLRHDAGVEKLYRDAKLLQIYEGTNQLNRIELFKKAVAPAEHVQPTPTSRAPRAPAGEHHDYR